LYTLYKIAENEYNKDEVVPITREALSQLQLMADTVMELQKQVDILKTFPTAQRNTKIADPEFFLGQKEKLRPFLNQLSMVFSLQGSYFNTDKTKVIYAASFLRDIAFEWFQPYLEKNDEILYNYKSFSMEL